MVKNLLANTGDAVSIWGQEDPLETGGNGNPLQSSCLGSPMGRGAWLPIGHGVTKELATVHRVAKELD